MPGLVRWRAAAMAIAGCLAVSVASAQAPTRLTLGTATPGGGFPVYGAAFVEALKEADPTLVIEAQNTKGSAENIPLLEEGKLDIALVQARPLTRRSRASAARRRT